MSLPRAGAVPGIVLCFAFCGTLFACAQHSVVPASFATSIQLADRRAVAVRIVAPSASCAPCDTIVFSHGNNLGFDQYDVLFDAWAKAGYLVVAPLHVDSEQHPHRDRYARDETLKPRLEDYAAIVDRLVEAPAEFVPGLSLSGRYFAAGHSYGALIAQMAGGVRLDGGRGALPFDSERRPLAVVAISPPGPLPDYLSAQGWSQLEVPHLVVTGTADVVPKYAPTWEAHLAAFEAGPAGRSYAIVFDDMDHYFNGSFGRLREPSARSRSAIVELNDAVLSFLQGVRRSGGPSEKNWLELSSEDAETRFR